MSIRSKTLRTTNYWKEILTESETILKEKNLNTIKTFLIAHNAVCAIHQKIYNSSSSLVCSEHNN